MMRFGGIEGRSVHVDARPGAAIENAARDAINLAGMLDCVVYLTHNDTTVAVVQDVYVTWVVDEWYRKRSKDQPL